MIHLTLKFHISAISVPTICAKISDPVHLLITVEANMIHGPCVNISMRIDRNLFYIVYRKNISVFF